GTTFGFGPADTGGAPDLQPDEDLHQADKPSQPGEKGCGPKLSCNDGNPCTVDSCQRGVGCLHAAVADGTACSDGDACTQADSCQSGACVGADPVVCTAADSCHDAGSCDPATGACS